MEDVSFKFPKKKKSSKLVQDQVHTSSLQHERYQPVQYAERENSEI